MTTHGISTSSDYRRWNSMLLRCYCPAAKDYPSYGGRGITVCDRWRFGEDGRHGVECYLEDMGHRPSGLSMDRTNNDGPYSPENCRWVGVKMQSRNRRSNRRVTIRGAEMPLVAALEITGISKQSFYLRMNRGMSESEALETPVTRPAAVAAQRRRA